ncbi:MAG TPA: CBS domain-containing protein [Steroidobacteraceae bacterium]|nr:CBS domain-containing protein [Steroidobacteraceae bacterium]
MLLKDLCTTDVAVCGRDTPLLQVAKLLRGRHAGDVVVVDDPDEERIPAGLITDRDIVVKVLAAGLDPCKVTAGRIMRAPLISAGEGEDSSEAVARMRVHGVRRLPITGPGGRLVGIVTLDDLLRLMVADAGALLGIVTKEQDLEHRTVR